jgi:GTPase
VVLGFVKDAAFPLLKDGTPVVITDADGGVIKRDKVTRIEHQKKPINLADPGVEVGMALENSHSDDLAPGMIIWTASDFLATH